MVDDVKDITETAESKASQEQLDRARLARERREAEQRKRLDELRAHAAAAQAQREKRDDDRRRRQAEQRARDDDKRLQVEERKRAIWEASVSRREALLQRERDRTERLERQRAARSAPRPAFAFGSSTPRLLEPLDSGGFFWAARSTNPIDQMNFFESLAASTTNVMFASAPLTRRASALQLDSSDTDNKDEPDRHQVPAMWSSVARRRTDLVPTLPAPRAPGRAYSMTRLDRLPHSPITPTTHLSRTQTRSGETTPGSRPGSALSTATGVVRRPATAPRKPRPASIAGTGVNTPRGGVGDTLAQSTATTPSVSRDNSVAGSDVPRRPASTPRRPRPASLHAGRPVTLTPGEGKPPLHRKPKPSKEHDKSRGAKSVSASPGRALSPSPPALIADTARGKEMHEQVTEPALTESAQISAAEVTHKLEALQIYNGESHADYKQTIDVQVTVAEPSETKPESSEMPTEQKPEQKQAEEKETQKQTEQKPVEHKEAPKKEEKREEKKEPSVEKKEPSVEKKEPSVEKKEPSVEKKEPSVEKTEEFDMTASMSRRITTEEQAKAALAERRRRAREELERQAELEKLRLQREAEEEAERQRLEREREMKEEQEARELAQLQRRMEEEKLRKAIEAQQQLERDEADRKTREEAERQAKLKEEEEKRKAAEEAEKLRKEEAEREEKERIARKQRVEAIMARTRLRKAEEDKKQQESKQPIPNQTAPATAPLVDVTQTPADNGAPAANDGAPLSNNGALASNNGALASNNGALASNNGALASSNGALSSNNGALTVDSVDNGAPVSSDNGNVDTGDLLGFTSQPVAPEPAPAHNNGNLADLLGLSQQHISEDKTVEQPTTKTPTIDNTTVTTETNNGNVHQTSDNTPQLSASQLSANQLSASQLSASQLSANQMSANFIQNEIATNESQTKMTDNLLLDDDFTTHNGHGTLNHPLTLQNAI